ncbi:MAG: O-antigen ligase family protein [Sphingomonadaceae bacterium]
MIGIILPAISALLYPTYRHLMEQPWVELTRLLELPFVAGEILVIHWALRRSMNTALMWRALPRDIRIGAAILLIGVFASSMAISANPVVSLTISLITVVHLLFALAVFHLVGQSAQSDVKPFLIGLGAGLVMLTVLTGWRFAVPPPVSELPGRIIEWSSALPGFISVRHFGSWSGAIAAAFAVGVLHATDRRPSLLHAFYFLAAAMTIWSGTRAAILAIALSSVILVVARRRLPDVRKIAHLAILTGAALLTAWLLLPPGDPAFRLIAAGDAANTNQLTGGRLELWMATFAAWLKSPWLGWGSGSVFWEVDIGWTHTQPHNVLLQFLVSWGLIGAVGGFWLLGRAIVQAHRTAMAETSLQPLLAMLYTLLLMSLLEGMLHYPRFIMAIMAVFAIILAHRPAKPAR